ncbi:hypothetical protein TNCV_4914621 [Trichonephila clavipes]|nr:hypothetical protein TNCV_4914621 [Trichonephila clavipes]
MKLKEKLISENHRDEFSATSGKPSISPSPLRLTSMHFSDVIPASEKKSNPMRQCSRDCAPVIEIPEISQRGKDGRERGGEEKKKSGENGRRKRRRERRRKKESRGERESAEPALYGEKG